jgi:hypothetical protein
MTCVHACSRRFAARSSRWAGLAAVLAAVSWLLLPLQAQEKGKSSAKVPAFQFAEGRLVVALDDDLLKKPSAPTMFNLHMLVPAATAGRRAGLVRTESGSGLKVQKGIGFPMITVGPEPIARGRPEGNTVTFQLPRNIDYQSNCFVVTGRGRIAERVEGGDRDMRYAFSLTGAGTAMAAASRLAAAESDLQREQSALDGLNKRVVQTRQSLASMPSYATGRCVAPPMGPLPPQPVNSFPVAQAREMAASIVIDAMSARFGCDMSAELTNRARKTDDWERFKSRFTCGQAGLSHFYVADAFTPFFDLLESWSNSCAVEPDERDRCLGARAALVALRYVADVDRIAQSLSTSYVQWQSQVATIRAEPQRQLTQCQEAVALINSSITGIETGERNLPIRQAARADARLAVEAIAARKYERKDWVCPQPFASYNIISADSQVFVD